MSSMPFALLKCRVRVMSRHVELDVAADKPLGTFTVTFRDFKQEGSVGAPTTPRRLFNAEDDDKCQGVGSAPLPDNFKVEAVVRELWVEVVCDVGRPAVWTAHDVKAGEWFDVLAGTNTRQD